ncbi:MAG TPA: prolipoprotein diacylglyceryl transferase [Thermomicrobiales bacterium]|nr:prolipoprotein diacylglyceryl transferase [Thermomicrobiales bacterium]
MRIHIGMDPNILKLGPFVLAWHGVLTVVAIFVALWIFQIGLRERRVTLEGFDSFVLWSIAGGIIGARVFFLIDHAGYFVDHPGEAIKINEGGLAIWGAVIGGFIAVAALCWARKYPFRKVIDAIAPGLIVAQAVGRIGCAINGDAWGAPTSWPFAFIYTNPNALLPSRLLNVPTHPYPVYDMIMAMLILAVIWPLRKRGLPDGSIFAVYAALYGATRFVISYVREERVWFWGMQEAQVVSLVVVALALIALAWLLRGRPATATETEMAISADQIVHR